MHVDTFLALGMSAWGITVKSSRTLHPTAGLRWFASTITHQKRGGWIQLWLSALRTFEKGAAQVKDVLGGRNAGGCLSVSQVRGRATKEGIGEERG